eukprot:scaffold53552_cov14-Tisochrysis_lutea.AAC.1
MSSTNASYQAYQGGGGPHAQHSPAGPLTLLHIIQSMSSTHSPASHAPYCPPAYQPRVHIWRSPAGYAPRQGALEEHQPGHVSAAATEFEPANATFFRSCLGDLKRVPSTAAS